MISKVTALAVLSALADQATAAAHVQHRRLHERDLVVETETTTIWETVTIYIGADGKPTPAADSGNAGNDEIVNSHAVPTTTDVVVEETPGVNIDQPKPTTTAAQQQQQPSSVSSAAPVSSAPSNGGNNGGNGVRPSAKRGIGYDEWTHGSKVKEACGSKCGWIYNWNPQPKANGDVSGYIPQMKQPFASGDALWPQWWEEYKSTFAAKAEFLFSFNEPDRPDQANTTPQQAAVEHAKYFKEFIGKASISSPAVSSDVSANMGLDWLAQFDAACTPDSGCHYDFCNVHWYGEDETELFNFIGDAYEQCTKGPIWITELGFPDGGSYSADQAAAFIKKITPKLEEDNRVAAWAWFFSSSNKPWYLNSPDGSLTSAGIAFTS